MDHGRHSGSHYNSGRPSQNRYRSENQTERRRMPVQQDSEFVDINSYSASGRKKAEKMSAEKKKKIAVSVVCLVLTLVFALVGTGFIYVGNSFGKYNYDDGTSKVSGGNAASAAPKEEIKAQVQETYDDPDMINGLYHDDAVLNILLMGVDDWQAGDVGRTDSMMLISIDRRHKELKVTSFMRDMYVNIEDCDPNRINAAYTLGGPDLLVDTIEKNFGVDIDRYVQINYDAFATIVDILGGVEMELSQAEADVINKESGETEAYAVEGLNNLTGKQARYYARIRYVATDESDDYGRTLRQRNIFSSIVNKFKSSSLLTMTKLADEIVPLVQSDLTQEEIFTIVTDVLTYMNYEMKQCRIPSDEMHYLDWVILGGMDASVIIPDTAWNTLYLNEFVYGDSFPELKATLEYNGYSTCQQKSSQDE